MDDPGLDQGVLTEVFEDIDRANSLLGGNNITISAVNNIIRDYPDRELTLLDVGCGGGAMLRTLARYGRKNDYKMRLIGIDLSEQALAIAREQSKEYSEISYINQDILSLREGDFDCDILLCTLTMHHFHNEEIALFLKKFRVIANIAVVINDLQRSRWAHGFFKVFSAIFIRSEIAKHDGLVSIRSGFTLKELKKLALTLPGVQHSIKSKWAFRYAWVMRTDRLK